MVLNMQQLLEPSIDQSQNEEISELVFNERLSGLSNFEAHTTDTFFVSGNPWHIKFVKILKNGQHFLGVYLSSSALFLGWIEKNIAAACNIKLLPPGMIGRGRFERDIIVSPFSIHNSIWGIDNFIAWDELVDGYTRENSCQIVVKVQATKLLNAARNEWLNFQDMSVPQYAGIQNINHGKFRMAIKEIHNIIGVCSPSILFDECTWRIVVQRRGDFILVTLFNLEEQTRRISCSVALKSFNSNIQPITTGADDLNFNLNTLYVSFELISMQDLIDPEKEFVSNDEPSLVIEVDLKANPLA